MGNEVSQVNYSYEVPNSAQNGFSAVRRSLKSTDRLITHYDEQVNTLSQSFFRGATKYPNSPCLGRRRTGEDGKAAEFVYQTYAEVAGRVVNLASGLMNLVALDELSRIGLYSINRPEWVIGEQACNFLNLVTVPLYDTLGPDAVAYIVNQAEIPVVFCSADKIAKILEVISECQTLKYIVSMDAVPENQRAGAESSGVTLVSMADLENSGKSNQIQSRVSRIDQIATICYTSGTTGNPKGVMLTHGNFMSMIGGVILEGVNINETDVHISYLPLAHMFERAIMTTCLYAGSTIGFYQGEITKLFDDIQTLRPTIFPSVPRLFNRLYDKINTAINQAGGMKKWLFDTGLSSKLDNLKAGSVTSGFWDSILFDKIKEKLGGRVRIIITGSAPLQAVVQDFLQVCFCCPVVQGYGLTETCAASTVSALTNTLAGHVGSPLACCEIRLADVPEMNYLSTDQNPRGEVQIRGNNIFVGYYKMEDKTREEFTTDGWFKSGDVGQFNHNGTLSIIDRKKNIFKLAQGEYVAAEYIENVIVKAPHMLQVFVYGDSYKPVLVAIAVPDPDTLIPWAQSSGIQDTNIASLCNNPAVKKMIFEGITRTGQAAKLRGFEFPKDIFLSAIPFSVENGLLTPTFKLKRAQAKQAYQEAITQMYASLEKAEAAKPQRD